MKPTGDQSCVSAFPIPIARTVLTFPWAEEEEQIACWDSPQAEKGEQSARAEGMLSLIDSSDSCPSTVARIPAGWLEINEGRSLIGRHQDTFPASNRCCDQELFELPDSAKSFFTANNIFPYTAVYRYADVAGSPSVVPRSVIEYSASYGLYTRSVKNFGASPASLVSISLNIPVS
jgi:hypothetical protein